MTDKEEKQTQQDKAAVYRRRPHYSGRYPRRFEEKYKELNPEKYGETIEHVKSKGSTPAGMHVPIMVEEILAVLDIKEGEQGYDATLGYGGHTSAMLAKLNHSGRLYAGDADPLELAKTEARLRAQGWTEEDFAPRHMNFSRINELAAEVGGFDFILADLGVSSMQLDNPERGFSYKTDGPLDLRLDPTQGKSAAERLAELDEAELCGLLETNADEPYAAQISRAVVRSGRRRKIETTQELAEVVKQALAKEKFPAAERREAERKACARVFQALRIDVNREYEVLYDFLEKLPHALRPGGRVAILTFHSGEDRLVKQALKAQERAGLYSEIAREVTRPSAAECGRNPRSRSTKLRWAIRA